MSLFSIGLSGLNAAQNALYATSNNISNVYTPGYNRELVLLGERGVGNGVQVNDIQRQFDQYVAGQLNQSTSNASALQAYETQVSQIDNLLADQEAGLAPLIQNFFSSLEDLAGAPSDPSSRQGVIGSADTLSAQFRSFQQYLDDMQNGINGQISDEITQINNTAEQIANLNREIALAKAKQGEAPNALLNQRDQLVAELSERIDVKLSVQESGTYNLSIGNGQPLVAGTRSFELEAVESKTDPSRLVVGYHDSAGNLVELKSKNIQGGSLGGLLNFREETLDKTQNELGRLAVSLAQAFNEQHRDGVDLNGDAGGDLFAIGSPRLYSHADNTGTATLSVAFGDAEGLTTSDYTVTVVDPATGEFAITRNDNGETVNATLDANNQLSFGGVVVTIDDPAQLAANDRFEVQPTRYAAGGMEMLIRDTAEIAAGSAAGSGNNENALALQELQNQSLVSGNATFSQAYASLVGDVGNRTNIVKVNLAAQQGLQEQLSAVQQSVSGVDLNEEAANLIRFQQYFQANAKVIEVGSTVLDSILGLR
ncbi:flagellar hook-associated protein FlgK [Alloalcanivorax xenomutans]|jgi:flagellar hook-associated protein 1|uniref:flagellar hook-associated protein FlgK n=1 Tax=Alloalcanivorax xenomutans TaxID=1094342 RepID=UPI0003B8FC7B|nr:flagellar hook-associated protein FlgK [Alloalcanivorax xenomutans]ERS13442.1 flagellar hook protein [Alcanivorax sp. PN-3]MBA4720365.1 flagellar hook-associated protein FlgK [Alcanivorax sp.]PHS69404.1 MAG: flagellar hook-associated protein FlgK [Alcanivorax sp.]WOD27365.1 flagellar hook-associated protein FlgK [Alloalcanivorax xenomutans]CUR44847.1 Flagellar hook-associated protein FlgK [Alloalcanivorax xenomutans]|tara:strand:- start:625 stop:2244 length:1620 start_codon:yes stop_codon:yes gene_type:complete